MKAALLLIACFLLLMPMTVHAAALITLHPGDIIVAEGDSLTYGQDYSATGVPLQQPFNGSINNRSPAPYPETLQKLLNDKVTVENHGYPGDRTVEGLERWKDSTGGALTLIMYGTNDCFNYSNYASGKLDIVAFTTALQKLVARRLQSGAKVILLTPSPLPDAQQNRTLDPYRAAVKNLAARMGVGVEDTVLDLERVNSIWTDGVHLSVTANRAIAEALARRLQVQQR